MDVVSVSVTWNTKRASSGGLQWHRTIPLETCTPKKLTTRIRGRYKESEDYVRETKSKNVSNMLEIYLCAGNNTTVGIKYPSKITYEISRKRSWKRVVGKLFVLPHIVPNLLVPWYKESGDHVRENKQCIQLAGKCSCVLCMKRK